MLPKNGRSGMTMPGRNSAVMRLLVERNDRGARRLVAVLGHEAAAAVVAVVDREIDRQDLHLERVTRLRALDVDRSGQDVTAGPRRSPVTWVAMPSATPGSSLAAPRALEADRGVGQQCVDVDDVARRDAQSRLGLRPVISVRDRCRAWPRGDAFSVSGPGSRPSR